MRIFVIYIEAVGEILMFFNISPWVLAVIPPNLLNLWMFRNELRKLSEESLQRQPEEVFDVLEKLGEGLVSIFSYTLC